jgi:chromatin remodeling complex protein RSC6
MAKFTGWNHDELKSRVDVTKYICKYIRDNNLQNPEDRRQIIADKKLAKLLDFNPEKDDKPLTYYRIQTYMKKHFTNPPKVDA